VYPFSDPLCIGKGEIEILSNMRVEADGTMVRRYELTGGGHTLTMEEVQTPGDSSWKARSRWIENDDDLAFFLELENLTPTDPDIEEVRQKERQVGEHGLPYIETPDPFYLVCEMFPTDTFYIKTKIDVEPIMRILSLTKQRVIHSIETLLSEAKCPFILRLIGAEMAAPPFMSRDNFLLFEGDFYQQVADLIQQYDIPASFHCHGSVGEIMDDIWNMGYSFIEPFEPSPRGNVTIAKALETANGRGIVFGGVDDVIFNTGSPDDISRAVKRCLDDARGTGKPYILSQSSTPFYEPLSGAAKENFLLFMELGTQG
ncbi:MAG TPA: hypothetical protein ENH82_11560, partial [bacterium]|nr:hypothetical protein [bacterium]